MSESDEKPERQKSAPRSPTAAVEKKTPRDHALATGNGPKRTSRNQWTGPGFSRVMGSVEHEVAKVLHGWDDHEHETGKPIELSESDYLAALKATMPEKGNPQPHAGALSPYRGKRGALALGQKPEGARS
jgi:hypothetical protein